MQLGASQLRNEKLASLFYHLGLIEAYGIGIGRILNAYKEYPLKPTLEAVEVAFKVTLPNMNVLPTTNTETQDIVIQYLEKHHEMTRQDIENLLSIKQTRANAIIKEMLQKQIIIKIGQGKNNKYILSLNRVGDN